MTGALWDSCSVHRSHPSSRSIRRPNSPNCSCIPSFLQFRGSTCFSWGTVETWRCSKILDWKADILQLLQLRRPRVNGVGWWNSNAACKTYYGSVLKIRRQRTLSGKCFHFRKNCCNRMWLKVSPQNGGSVVNGAGNSETNKGFHFRQSNEIT